MIGTAEELEDLPTEHRYELTCKVLKKNMSYRDHQSRGKQWNNTAEVILLVPEQTTEASQFFKAWLPDPTEVKTDEWGRKLPGYSEIGIRAGSPLQCFIRGALYRGNQLLEKPHIFVMSKRAEDVLQHYVGKKISLTVLGEQEFDEAYEAKAETKNPYE